MRQAALLIPTLVGILLGPPARASDVDVVAVKPARAPNISAEFLDPSARTRFHLTTRFTFADGTNTFTNDARTTFEAKALIGVHDNVAVGFVLPFGLTTPTPGDDNFFIGNVRASVAGGGVMYLSPPQPANPDAPRLGIGGGLDLYIPTLREFELGDCGVVVACNPTADVRNTRSYEPELYLERSASARLRGHIDFSISIITAELELGLSPSLRVKDDDTDNFRMFFTWGVRLAARPIDALEPFVEAGSAILVSGDPLNLDDLDTPTLLTVGLRGHFEIDPAIFVSFDLSDGGILFGIDLAAAFKTTSREAAVRDPLDGLR